MSKTATVLIYPNKLDHSEREELTAESGQTIEHWLIADNPNYRPLAAPPITISRNGSLIPSAAWSEEIIQSGDLIEIEVQPKDPMSLTVWEIVSIVMAVASAAYTFYAMSQIPDNYAKTTKSGSSIYSANAQGNSASLMSVIPEQAGRHKAYPDYKAEPHTYYKDNKQYRNILLSQGLGWFEHSNQTVYIGNTPVTDYGGVVDMLIADPGASISTHPAHRCMYTSTDVGSTSSTAGFDLKGPISVAETSANGLRCIFSGSVITIRKPYYWVSYNSFLDEWESTTYYKNYSLPWPADTKFTLTGTSTVVGSYSGNVNLIDTGNDGLGNPLPDEIHAPFGLSVFSVNQEITLINAGPNSGNYFIRSVTDTVITLKDETGAAITWITPANNVSVVITSSQSDDGLYKIVSITDGLHTVAKIDPSSYEILPGWAGFTASGELTGISMEVLNSELVGEAVGPYRSNPINQTSTYYELDFLLPKGLGYLNNDGGFDSRSVSIKIEYRKAGSSDSWQSYIKTFSGADNDQMAETVPFTLANDSYEWRCTNTTPTSEDTKLLDQVQWVGLKTLVAAPTSYDDETVICLSVLGTEGLSAASENKISTFWTRKLEVPDGAGGWTTTKSATRDIAPFFRHVLHDAGYGDDKIVMDALLSLHALWVSRGEELNARFDEDSTVEEVLKRCLAAGMAELTTDYGQLLPIRRGVRSVPERMYQPQNMIADSVNMSLSPVNEDEPDGIEVEYTSSDTWKSDTVLCLIDEDTGANPEKVRLYGVTDRTQAWRYGMRKRMQKKLRTLTGKFSTEMDAFNSRYASCDAIGVDFPGMTQTGRIVGIVGTILETDNKLTTYTGMDTTLLLRKSDGTASGPYTATVIDEHHLLLDRALDFTPDLSGQIEFPLYQFGQFLKVWIESLKPSGDSKIAVEFSIYDDNEFYHDNRYPSLDDYPVSLDSVD